jgi:hypothetical protein
LLPVLPRDRGCRLQADSDGAAFVDKGALGGNPFDDILGDIVGGLPRYPPLSVRRHAFASFGLSLYRTRDRAGDAVWRRITHAVLQLENKTRPGPAGRSASGSATLRTTIQA